VIIGHLPAAYLLGRIVSKTLLSNKVSSGAIIPAALVGGIIPDFDLAYFYTIGGRQVVHHEYWSHIPFYWVVIYLSASLVALSLKALKAIKILFIVFLAILLHLALDTITGQIHWLYPFSDATFTLVQVSAVHGWWVANFLLHWTFAVELLVLALAIFLHFKRGSG